MVGNKDPAIIGDMRVGYFRIGVKNPLFDRQLIKSDKVTAKNMGGRTAAVYDTGTYDNCRYDVPIPLFDAVLRKVEKT